MIYVCLADGFEEMEAISPIDILRRAGCKVQTVGVTGAYVTGSHGIQVKADIATAEMDFSQMEMLILPGGVPGTPNLEKDETVQAAIRYCLQHDLFLAAICAAPSILGHAGALQGKNAICYPGYEPDLTGATVSGAYVCRDGKIITARGAGVAAKFGFALAAALKGEAVSKEICSSMQCEKGE